MIKKTLWNNKEIEVVQIHERWFALSGWNGEVYTNCWETDENTYALENNKIYVIKPITKGIGKPDEDDYYEVYETTAYEILY